MRVGLTGGIGAGKTAVADMFESFGAFAIDTDALAREAVGRNTPALAEIARAWPGVVQNGRLNRPALAEIVFGDSSARERLNAIVHPRVRELAARSERSARPGQLVVHVVPLLFETDYAQLVDKTVLVVAPETQRLARIVARDGGDEAHARARIDAQIPPDRARARADYVIENDGSLEDLRARARAVYDRLASS
jgi:dephospho-CoA kinase